ncbi:MAG TPA: DUF2812 domain-containing protein [Bacillales bacterium]|nr:DUF2812 domain-containing protein [Bacillales bacterium]
MRQTKYVPSGGTAYTESKDMKKLGEYAKKGWILESFVPFGYKLRKGESKNIEYSLDYRKIADDDYFAYFEAAGWTHVCSMGNQIHVFKAPAGTKPIYSDKITQIEKYETEKKRMGKVAFPTLILTSLLLLLGILSSYGWIPVMIGTAGTLLGIVSLIVLVFTGLPYIGFKFKLNRLRKD